MHIITQTKLRAFGKAYPDADEPLRVWETLMRSRKFKNPHEVKSVFNGVDFIGGNKTVFEIGGNKIQAGDEDDVQVGEGLGQGCVHT